MSMSKLNKAFAVSSLNSRIDELNAMLAELKSSTTLSENTIRTQTHVKTHEKKLLLLQREFINNCDKDDLEIPEEMVEWFESVTTLTSKRINPITLKEGDDVIAYMQEHPEIKFDRIKKYLEKEGLVLKGSTVTSR